MIEEKLENLSSLRSSLNHQIKKKKKEKKKPGKRRKNMTENKSSNKYLRNGRKEKITRSHYYYTKFNSFVGGRLRWYRLRPI